MLMISPCLKICKVKNGVCIGCGRNLDQIKNWKNYSDKKRKTIIKNLKSFSYKE